MQMLLQKAYSINITFIKEFWKLYAISILENAYITVTITGTGFWGTFYFYEQQFVEYKICKDLLNTYLMFIWCLVTKIEPMIVAAHHTHINR